MGRKDKDKSREYARCYASKAQAQHDFPRLPEVQNRLWAVENGSLLQSDAVAARLKQQAQLTEPCLNPNRLEAQLSRFGNVKEIWKMGSLGF